MIRKPASAAASNTGSTWLPETEKTISVPIARSVRATICPPVRSSPSVIGPRSLSATGVLDRIAPYLHCSGMNNQAVASKRRQLNGPWVMFAILGAAGDIERKADAALSEIGLSLPKLGVLWELASEDEPMALSELARCNK